jgi:polyphosphate kinase
MWFYSGENNLSEAGIHPDDSVPLLERLRFLWIYSSNMDEFYRVRVADVRRKILLSNNI